MRVVFLGGLGAYSAAHLDALASAHDVVGVVCGVERSGPRAEIGRVLRAWRLLSDPCGDVCRRHRVRRWIGDRPGARAAEIVAALKPDVIAVAGYPWLLPANVWTQAPLGAFNSHASLLPRHRGVLPLFWIYYHDDRETGVTVHAVAERVDAGAIVCQERYPLARGYPVDQLNAQNIACGSRLLVQALDLVKRGEVRATPQDESAATRATRVKPGTPMVDFSWDVERVWHFLAGLCPRFIEPLRDERGAPARYRAVAGFERRDHGEAAGTVRRSGSGLRLYCHGGVVDLTGTQ